MAVVFLLQQYEVLPVIEGTLGVSFAANSLGATILSTANAGVYGGIGGAIATGTVKGTLIGAGEAVAFAGVHIAKADLGFPNDSSAYSIGQIVESAGMHGLVGGLASVAGGSNFQSGFLAGCVSDATNETDSGDLNAMDFAKNAVAGGFASVLGGGKFGNGALTGAFGYLYNHCLEPNCNDQGQYRQAYFSKFPWWDPWKYAGPLLPDYSAARRIGEEELDNHGRHNDMSDALRHAHWSERMDEEVGPFTAWSAGVGHELQVMLHGQPLDEWRMDSHKNWVGRQAGEAGKPINPKDLQVSPDRPAWREPYRAQ